MPRLGGCAWQIVLPPVLGLPTQERNLEQQQQEPGGEQQRLQGRVEGSCARVSSEVRQSGRSRSPGKMLSEQPVPTMPLPPDLALEAPVEEHTPRADLHGLGLVVTEAGTLLSSL